MSRRALGCFVVVLAVVGGARASDFPTPQHGRLDPLAGTWDVATRFKVGPDRFAEGTATCESEWILDGRFLKQTYESKINGEPFTVIQHLGYDDARKVFFELKMDSMDNGLMHNEGTISADGKVLTLAGERTDPTTGKTSKIRTVTTIVDADHYTLDWYLPGEDGKEEKAVTLTHTRRKP